MFEDRRSLGITLALTSLLAACGASAPPPPSTARETSIEQPAPIERRHAEGTALEAPAQGTCGELAGLALGTERSVLGDRVRLQVAASAEQTNLPHDIMSAPPSAQGAELVWIEAGRARMAILVEELFRTAGADLETALAQHAPEGWDHESLDARQGARRALLTPRPLRDREGDVVLLEAYLVARDGLVVRAKFVTSPDVAATGGCISLARRMAESLAPGDRAVELRAGERVLFGDLAIELGARHALVVDEGPDFSVYRVHAVVPLGAPGGSLGIYAGHHPSFSPPIGATRRTARVLGSDVTWHDAISGELRESEALIETQQGVMLHVFYGAAGAALYDELRAAAESLHRIES